MDSTRATGLALLAAAAVSLPGTATAKDVSIDNWVSGIIEDAAEAYVRQQAGLGDSGIVTIKWKGTPDFKFLGKTTINLEGGNLKPVNTAAFYSYQCNEGASEEPLNWSTSIGSSESYSVDWTTGIELSTSFKLQESGKVLGAGISESMGFNIGISESFTEGRTVSQDTENSVGGKVIAPPHTEFNAQIQVAMLEVKDVHFTMEVNASGNLQIDNIEWSLGGQSGTIDRMSAKVEDILPASELTRTAHGVFDSGSDSTPRVFAGSGSEAHVAAYYWTTIKDLTDPSKCTGNPASPPPVPQGASKV